MTQPRRDENVFQQPRTGPISRAGKSKRRAERYSRQRGLEDRSCCLGCRAALSASRIVASGATVYDYVSRAPLTAR
jgi:hypothetical protein